jgi:hypothetical protein
MSGELFFEVPDDSETMVKIVEAIPDDTLWWLRGSLCAMPKQLAAGTIERESGVVVSSSSIELQGKDPWSLATGEKLPAYVEFKDVGYFRHSGNPIVCKRVAAAFLKKGYHRGQLEFFRHCEYDDHFDQVATCEIFFKAWRGHTPFVGHNEVGMQPARVKLSWDERFRGKEEHIAQIVLACRELHLKEYIPKANAS